MIGDADFLKFALTITLHFHGDLSDETITPLGMRIREQVMMLITGMEADAADELHDSPQAFDTDGLSLVEFRLQAIDVAERMT
jgi:hypothetical protein